MPFIPSNFFRELEQFNHYLHSAKVYNGFIEPLQHFLGGGPKVQVFDEGETVRVVIDAPGLAKDSRHHWSMRVIDQALHLRGEWIYEEFARQEGRPYYNEQRSEQFTRVIPLPFSVRRKPVSVKAQNGVVTVLLAKQKEKQDDGWISIP